MARKLRDLKTRDEIITEVLAKNEGAKELRAMLGNVENADQRIRMCMGPVWYHHTKGGRWNDMRCFVMSCGFETDVDKSITLITDICRIVNKKVTAERALERKRAKAAGLVGEKPKSKSYYCTEVKKILKEICGNEYSNRVKYTDTNVNSYKVKIVGDFCERNIVELAKERLGIDIIVEHAECGDVFKYPATIIRIPFYDAA